MGTTGYVFRGYIMGTTRYVLGRYMGDNKGILGRDNYMGTINNFRYLLWRYGDDVPWRYVTFYPSCSLPYLVVTPDERPPFVHFNTANKIQPTLLCSLFIMCLQLPVVM